MSSGQQLEYLARQPVETQAYRSFHFNYDALCGGDVRVRCGGGDLDALPVRRRDEERKNSEETLHEVGGGG